MFLAIDLMISEGLNVPSLLLLLPHVEHGGVLCTLIHEDLMGQENRDLFKLSFVSLRGKHRGLYLVQGIPERSDFQSQRQQS